jgi:hypothetical protein
MSKLGKKREAEKTRPSSGTRVRMKQYAIDKLAVE